MISFAAGRAGIVFFCGCESFAFWAKVVYASSRSCVGVVWELCHIQAGRCMGAVLVLCGYWRGAKDMAFCSLKKTG